MCDGAAERGKGWRGWRDLPARPAGPASGPWLDLSHPLRETMPRASVFPQPQFRRVKSLPADPLNVTEMRMVVHLGTHVDAPRHFFSDGPAFDEIPLERLCGPGVVLRIDAAPLEELTASHLERARPDVRPGDIVALDTGWSAHAGTPVYERHPYLGLDAARWLVERGVKLVACDFITPDQPVDRRAPGFDWPIHHALLGSGVLVCENLTGHRALAGRRAELLFLALNIHASDGAPARVVARALTG
jgi:kynurenine formamidase